MPARRRFRGVASALAAPYRQGLSWHSCSSRNRTISPSRITFTNGGHQDVKELIGDVLRRLNIRV